MNIVYYCIFLGLLSWTTGAVAGVRCKADRTPTEVVICGTPELMQLDSMLDAAYQAAIRVAQQPEAVDAEQSKWVSLRDSCDRYDCLEPLYRSRIAALHDFQIKAHGSQRRPLAREDKERVCSEIARLIDARRIDGLRLLTRHTHPPGTGFELTDAEGAGVQSLDVWPVYFESARVYDLKIRNGGSTSRFAQFTGRRHCESATVVNLDDLLASKGRNDGRMNNGSPSYEWSWSSAAAEDRLVMHEGRYFMFSGNPRVPRSMLWEVTEDAKLQRLCTLRTATTERVVRKARDPNVCNAMKNGLLLPIKWVPLKPPADARPLANDAGDAPIEAMFAGVGPDAKGTPMIVVRLMYPAESDCGTVRT